MTTTQTNYGKYSRTAALIALATILLSSGSQAQSTREADDLADSEAPTVLITGANRGIGLELARQYSKAGWRVIGTARRPDGAEELNLLGAEVMQLDVTDPSSVERLARDLDKQPIDLLINNAGILPMMRTLPEVDIDTFNRVIAVNTVGPVLVTRAVLPNLRSGNLRKIVNITSNLGSIAGNTNGGFYGYRESKAALNMFTRSLAAELDADGFICIVMHPGWVQTDMGGTNAPTSVQQSVTGMRRVIGVLSGADNGTAWTHEGKTMAW